MLALPCRTVSVTKSDTPATNYRVGVVLELTAGLPDAPGGDRGDFLESLRALFDGEVVAEFGYTHPDSMLTPDGEVDAFTFHLVLTGSDFTIAACGAATTLRGAWAQLRGALAEIRTG